MTEWLAVIVICLNGECAFWASAKEPIETKRKCEIVIEAVTAQLNRDGAETPLAACIPIRWIKT